MIILYTYIYFTSKNYVIYFKAIYSKNINRGKYYNEMKFLETYRSHARTFWLHCVYIFSFCYFLYGMAMN